MAKWQTNELCVAKKCWTENGNTFHHVLTRGAWPEFQHEDWNKMPLCFNHHTEVHNSKTGLSGFAEKYPSVKNWLLKKGWTYEENRWACPVTYLRFKGSED